LKNPRKDGTHLHPDTLEYLARRTHWTRQGDRGALPTSPVIRVDSDGKYTTVSTGRTIGKSINAISEHLRNKYAHTPVWVTVLHGRFAEKADVLANELKEKLNIARFEVKRISPVLGVHTGPGIVGAAVVPMELMEDLMK
jgi:fatty acid-binding protein DegV